MKKSQRTPPDPRPARDLTDRELSSATGGTGGTTGGTTATRTSGDGYKLGNKIWQDDWLAPV